MTLDVGRRRPRNLLSSIKMFTVMSLLNGSPPRQTTFLCIIFAFVAILLYYAARHRVSFSLYRSHSGADVDKPAQRRIQGLRYLVHGPQIIDSAYKKVMISYRHAKV